MTSPNANDARVRAWNAVHALEGQAYDLEACLGLIKRLCMHDGDSAAVAEATAELRTLVRQLNQDVAEAELALDSVTDRLPPPERRAVRRPDANVLRGSTDIISVADLFGFLGSLHKTGTLSLQAPDSMFVFELQDGVIVHATTNLADPELRLGTILVQTGLMTEAELQERVQESVAMHMLLGAYLVDQHVVTADDMRSVLEEQVHRIFEAVFATQGATFTFTEGVLSRIAQRANLSTTKLLLEAARQDDERRRSTGNALDTVLPG